MFAQRINLVTHKFEQTSRFRL